jgi:hypothetical protein
MLILYVIFFMIGLLIIYKLTQQKENYENCNKNSCNIDTYNLKYISGVQEGNINDGEYKTNDKIYQDKPDEIAKFNSDFYGFYNQINNNSAQRWDPVDKINFDTCYENNKVSDVYNYLTSYTKN